MSAEVKRMEKTAEKGVRTVQSNYDIVLIMLVILLSVFGLVMIYSVSSYNAARYYNDANLYFRRQGLFLIIGLMLMLIVSMIDYHIYINPLRWLFGVRPIWLFYLLCLGLQIYVLVNGYEAGGSSRWIQIPKLGNFQPSELTKICVILLVAYLVQRVPNKINYFYGFVAVAIFVGPLLALVAMLNLSTAVVLAGIFGVICFVAAKKKGYFVIVIILMIAFLAVFVFAAGYRSERIDTWLHPEDVDPSSQIVQGLYAIASGGLWGKGLGHSIQKMGFITEVHTDMIFTVICEELGIFGAIMVIAVFLMLLWRLLHIAVNAPDMFGGLIATGVLTHIALQVLLNIAVVTGSIPATGIPFPFISYGGSSLTVLLIEMGIALSVSKYTNRERATDE